MTMRMGGFWASMVWICTGEVWVRSTLRSPLASGRQEKCVVHFAGRMAFGEIQRREIVIVGFDVRTFGNGKSHVGKDRRDLVHHLGDRMNAPGFGGGLAHRQGDINGFGFQALLQSRRA